MKREFFRFALVGIAGLLVDMGALWVALDLAGAGYHLGRVFSYLVAATFTWWCNRTFTFTASPRGDPIRQWLRFLAVNAVGGLVNFAVYSAVVAAPRGLLTSAGLPGEAAPYLGVALGSAAGLVFNFVGSRTLAFR